VGTPAKNQEHESDDILGKNIPFWLAELYKQNLELYHKTVKNML
jgi:hypothetical protein